MGNASTARRGRDFPQLSARGTQHALAAQHFLRPLDGQLPTNSQLTLANGTTPFVTVQQHIPLPDPDATIGATLIFLPLSPSSYDCTEFITILSLLQSAICLK